ncbi:response regulator transcription factor [Thermomonas brevis]|nr:response regulator transcription factor [Thermomonas brevis]
MVVEDDDELRDRILVPGLRGEGFDADGVDSAMALYRALNLRSYGMFVVDIGLPDESGFAVVRHLRELGGVGIVMLTGRADEEDRVRGLDGGADAYLAKPIGVNVLAATLRSVLRRMAPDASTVEPAPHASSGWRLEQQGWQLVSPSGSQVALSKGERLLLTLLADSAGTAVEKETILQHLCGNDDDFDPHRLEMLVHRLRRKVQTLAGEELPLVTVRGVGHLFLP